MAVHSLYNRFQSIVVRIGIISATTLFTFLVFTVIQNSMRNTELARETRRLAIVLRKNEKLVKQALDLVKETQLNATAQQREYAANIAEKLNQVEVQRLKNEQLVNKLNQLTKRSEKPKKLELAPGEMGQPVIINVTNLSAEEKKKYDEGWRRNAFNQYAADMISLNRSLPDFRFNECKRVQWFHPLPTVSVVIIFFNEALSVLLRTVHSVLYRSDPALLVEIILVDDASTFDHLKQPLDNHIRGLHKVRVLRHKKRQGLIKARMTGAKSATAEVLVIMDSHMEATDGWLEPLLDPIARNPNASTMPVVRDLSADDFRIHYDPLFKVSDIQVGGFNWELIHFWKRAAEHHYKTPLDPIPSPVMIGCIFAINRKYFKTIGQYDPGLAIWGGENMELPFKLWMCGGKFVTTPCSNVAHMYRKTMPYSVPGQDTIKRNLLRVAEVWLDEYKGCLMLLASQQGV